MKVFIYTKQKRQENYIKEWCDYHKKLGFDGIIIDNNNPNLTDPIYQDPFIEYIDRVGLVWTMPQDGTPMPHYDNTQVIWANEAKALLESRYPNEECWMFNTDIDEFLDFKGHYNNIQLYIESIREQGLWYKFIWWEYYDDNNIIYDKNDNCYERFTHKSRKNEYVERLTHSDKFGWWEGKSIIEVHHNDRFMCPHITKMDVPKCEIESRANVVIRHYYTKSLESWIKTKIPYTNTGRGRRHPNVIKTFFEYNDLTLEKLNAIPILINKYLSTYKLTDQDADFIERKRKLFDDHYVNTVANRQIFITTRFNDKGSVSNYFVSDGAYGLYKTMLCVFKDMKKVKLNTFGFCYDFNMFTNDDDVSTLKADGSLFREVDAPEFLEYLCGGDNNAFLRKKIFNPTGRTYTCGNKFFTTRTQFIKLMRALVPIVNDFTLYVKKHNIKNYNYIYIIEKILIPVLLDD